MSNKNEQHYQQATFDQARPETRDLGPVTCLGMTFPNDEERRKHFLGILRAGLEELHDKLAVPFTSAEDTAQRLRSLQRWPLGGEDRIQHLARRIAESARSARGQDRT
ncbi:MAG: DNA methyltransferase, partial [Chloroflexota bacterium]